MNKPKVLPAFKISHKNCAFDNRDAAPQPNTPKDDYSNHGNQ